MVSAHPHDVALRGIRPVTGRADRSAPTILQLEEQEFVRRLLSELASESGMARIGENVARARNNRGVLRLYQPVHRLFHLLLVEVRCLTPHEPRLDPMHIQSAGLVVRRIDHDGEKAWVSRGGRIVGWRPVPFDRGSARGGYDPDPSLREKWRAGANRGVLAGMENAAAESAFLEEQVTPLFAAPPDVCAIQKKTLLYGHLPVTSSDSVDQPPPRPVPFGSDDIRQQLPALFTASEGIRQGGIVVARDSRELPHAGELFAAVDFLDRLGLYAERPAVERLRQALAKVMTGRDMFWWVPDTEVAGVLTLEGFMRKAHAVLMGRPPGAEAVTAPDTIRLPVKWFTISPRQEKAIVEGVLEAMESRWKMVEPGQGRYDTAGARYLVRAFIRVCRREGCPPRTWWSGPSEQFEIVPWHESSSVAPVRIELPEINLSALKNLKPNVSVKVPPSIQKFMGGMKLSGLMEGSVPEAKGEFGMICSFSMPIITICAFIVLQIFLLLLNIVFWWLPFVKICIPYPKPPSSSQGG
jgi:hypothetical protein